MHILKNIINHNIYIYIEIFFYKQIKINLGILGDNTDEKNMQFLKRKHIEYLQMYVSGRTFKKENLKREKKRFRGSIMNNLLPLWE